MSLSKNLQQIKKKILGNLSELEDFFNIIDSKAYDLDNHEKELDGLKLKIDEKKKEMESFRRVSFISNMSKQIKDKNDYIEVLEKRIKCMQSKMTVSMSPLKTVDYRSPHKVGKSLDKIQNIPTLTKQNPKSNGASQEDSKIVKVDTVVDKTELLEDEIVVEELSEEKLSEEKLSEEKLSEEESDDEVEVIKKKYRGVYYYVSVCDKCVYSIEDDASIGRRVGSLNKRGKIKLKK